MMKTKLMLLLPFLSLYTTLWAQGEGWQGILTVDNDFFWIPNNDDENYTGGAKLDLLFPEQVKIGWLSYHNRKTVNIQRFGLGGTAYTPQHLERSEPIRDDRPYASLVFFNVGQTSYDTANARIFQSDLIIGMIGTSLPGNAQAHIHEHQWLGSERPVPQGWGNQIGYHGSPILHLIARWELPIYNPQNNHRFKLLNIKYTPKLEGGNFMIHAQCGIKFNLFNINSGLMQDYIPGMPTGAMLAREEVAEHTPRLIRFNVFAEPQLKLVGYNATLEGLMFSDNSVYTINSQNINRVVFEYNAGFNMVIADRLLLKCTAYGRSREFEGGKKMHYWGGVSLGYSPAKWNR